MRSGFSGQYKTLLLPLPAATFAAPGTQLQMLSLDPCTQQGKESRSGLSGTLQLGRVIGIAEQGTEVAERT